MNKIFIEKHSKNIRIWSAEHKNPVSQDLSKFNSKCKKFVQG